MLDVDFEHENKPLATIKDAFKTHFKEVKSYNGGSKYNDYSGINEYRGHFEIARDVEGQILKALKTNGSLR